MCHVKFSDMINAWGMQIYRFNSVECIVNVTCMETLICICYIWIPGIINYTKLHTKRYLKDHVSHVISFTSNYNCFEKYSSFATIYNKKHLSAFVEILKYWIIFIRLLSKKILIRIYNTLILHLVLYG